MLRDARGGSYAPGQRFLSAFSVSIFCAKQGLPSSLDGGFANRCSRKCMHRLVSRVQKYSTLMQFHIGSS